MHTYSVQLRIYGETLDPDEVTKRLSLTPNLVRFAGDRRRENELWKQARWSYNGGNDTETEWSSLEDGLSYLLDQLMSRSSLINEYMEKYEVIWWCGHFQSSFSGGPTISGPILKRLGDFGVSLFIDNYTCDE